MVDIIFCDTNTPLRSSGTTLECQNFSKSLFGLPSDRHAYQLRCYVHPIRYNSDSFFKQQQL